MVCDVETQKAKYYDKHANNKKINLFLHYKLFHKFDSLATEAVALRCSVKNVFLEILQNSQENTLCQGLFFNKVASLNPATLLKKRLWHRCFPVNFEKFLRTLFLTEHLWRLVL